MNLSVFEEDNKYELYEVLIGNDWKIIHPWLPLMQQVRGMRGYRLWDYEGHIVKQFVR
jgi:hypothetical protein